MADVLTGTFCILLGVTLHICAAKGEYCYESKPYCDDYDLTCCDTPRGNEKICSWSCAYVCEYDSDCYNEEEVCHHRKKICTSDCIWDEDCRPGYKCVSSQCVREEETGDDRSIRTAIILTIVGVAFVSFCCCCFHVKRNPQTRLRAEAAGNQLQQLNTLGNLRQAPQTSQPTDQRLNGDRSLSGQPRDEPRTPDIVQDSGPPPYHTLPFDNSGEAEPPPPSYDEAVRTISGYP